MMMQNIVPLVLHQIVPDDTESQFEDVGLSIFRRILGVCQGRCVSVDGKVASNDLPGEHFLLTFDDGYISNFDIVLPLLKQTDCTAIFFIITEKIDTPGYLSWSQVRELHNAGMTIGSHSVSHSDMRCLSLAKQREELLLSRLCIEDRLGAAVTSFSFPFGRFNNGLVKLALDAGYHTVCTSQHGVTKLPAPLLPRNSINGSMSWASVLLALKAAPLTRFKWAIEDMAKNSARLAMGDTVYRSIRSLLDKGK